MTPFLDLYFSNTQREKLSLGNKVYISHLLQELKSNGPNLELVTRFNYAKVLESSNWINGAKNQYSKVVKIGPIDSHEEGLIGRSLEKLAKISIQRKDLRGAMKYMVQISQRNNGELNKEMSELLIDCGLVYNLLNPEFLPETYNPKSDIQID